MTSTSTDRIAGARSSLAIKAPVLAATTAAITLSGTQTIDGVALVSGDRVLVKNQASGIDNGIYIVDTGTWNRAPDADGNADWTKGTLVVASGGTVGSGFWQLITSGTIITGTTSMTFIQASLGTVTTFMQTVLNAADATTAAALLLAAGVSFTGDISPAALGGNTDDWAPAGFSTASTVRASSSAAINLTGIAGGGDGRIICLHNIGAFAITLKDDQTSAAANRFQMSNDYVLNPDASVVLEYDSTSSRWRAFGQQGVQASVSFNRLVNNVGLSVTAAASAMTVALKDATGADPSTSSAVTINFRSSTLANGTVTQVSTQAAASTVISSGSTGGITAGTQSRIFVAAINVGGTVELAWCNFGSLYPQIDENSLISTTAEGGAGTADSANVWYSTTARTNVAFTLLGYFDSTQAAAGTWATNPTTIAVNPRATPVVDTQWNPLINRQLRFDQVNEGTLYTVTGGGGTTQTIDGWSGQAVGAGSFKVRRLADPDHATKWCMEVSCTTADAAIGATDNYILWTDMEGYDAAELESGTSNAKQITLAFTVKSNSVTGVLGVFLRNSAGDRYYPATITINSANVEETEKLVTIQLDTAGTWLFTNGTGIRLGIVLAAGSNFQGTANAWTASAIETTAAQANFMSANTNILYIKPIRIGKGSVSPIGVDLSEQADLARCQRYAEKSYDQGVAVGTTATQGASVSSCVGPTASTFIVSITSKFSVTKRAVPANTSYSTQSGTSAKVRDSQAGVDVGSNMTYVGTTNFINQPTASGSSSTYSLEHQWYANARLS